MREDFFEKNAARLGEFVRLSNQIGARADYVQGGGGNTSVKLADGLMAVKASGFRLADVGERQAYAVLDGAALREFYRTAQPEELDDVEKTGSQKARDAIQPVYGLEPLRPSVEAGFHSILDGYVIHSHSVYANMAACAAECREIAERAFADADYAWGIVPYVDPGARLTFAIREELARTEAETGRRPSVLLLRNHGIIVHDDDPDRCLAVHRDANRRLAGQFGLGEDSFPAVRLTEREPGLYAADTPFLRKEFASGVYTEKFLLVHPLYPDQMVFLAGAFAMDRDTVEEGQCVASSRTGDVLLRMDRGRAQVLVETLTAVTFIVSHIRRSGYTLTTMDGAAKDFIAGWESEKYRRTLAGNKKV